MSNPILEVEMTLWQTGPGKHRYREDLPTPRTPPAVPDLYVFIHALGANPPNHITVKVYAHPSEGRDQAGQDQDQD